MKELFPAESFGQTLLARYNDKKREQGCALTPEQIAVIADALFAELAPSAKTKRIARSEQDLLIDALALIEGCKPPFTAGAGARYASALKGIRAATPNVTPAEIKERARIYRIRFPKWEFTAKSVESHWDECAPKMAKKTIDPYTNTPPDDWQERGFKRFGVRFEQSWSELDITYRTGILQTA